jgi:hypothetical protein
MIAEFVFEVKFVDKLRGVARVVEFDCKRMPLYGRTILLGDPGAVPI